MTELRRCKDLSRCVLGTSLSIPPASTTMAVQVPARSTPTRGPARATCPGRPPLCCWSRAHTFCHSCRRNLGCGAAVTSISLPSLTFTTPSCSQAGASLMRPCESHHHSGARLSTEEPSGDVVIFDIRRRPAWVAGGAMKLSHQKQQNQGAHHYFDPSIVWGLNFCNERRKAGV